MNETLWIVAIWEHGKWTDTWDGKLHTDKNEATGELEMARGAGYLAELAKVTIPKIKEQS